MTKQINQLNYDQMTENALRGVLREALNITARQGLPGEHYFYITFRSRFPGVTMPDRLLAAHPEEMTIVIQHQFWDIQVTEKTFGITLSFNDIEERIIVPFAAVTSFADPHARFGLQFGSVVETDDAFEAVEAEVAVLDVAPEKPAKKVDDKENEKGNVVALDAFRKK